MNKPTKEQRPTKGPARKDGKQARRQPAEPKGTNSSAESSSDHQGPADDADAHDVGDRAGAGHTAAIDGRAAQQQRDGRRETAMIPVRAQFWIDADYISTDIRVWRAVALHYTVINYHAL